MRNNTRFLWILAFFILIILITQICFANTKDLTNAVNYYSKKYEIEDKLIWAIIHVESDGFITNRNEKKELKNKKWIKNIIHNYNINTNDKYIYHALGPMQVLYFNCVALHGYTGKAIWLKDEWNGVKYGCKHYVYLKNRYKNKYKIISAYNYGNISYTNKIKIINGKTNIIREFKNQKYVNKVIRNYRKYGGIKL